VIAVPSVRFALPGRWLKAELDDEAAVAALSDRLPDEQRGDGAWLSSLRAAGAQTVLLRPGSTPAASIVFIWPPDESRGETSADALRTRLGIDGDVVPHDAGYAVVRERHPGAGSAQDVVTYAVAHPDTGRVLVLRCTAFEAPFEDFMVRDFDLAAGDLTWDET
jgi:hypothetical protein